MSALTAGWIHTMWFIHTMEYYLTVTKNEVLNAYYTMDKPQNIMQSMGPVPEGCKAFDYAGGNVLDRQIWGAREWNGSS